MDPPHIAISVWFPNYPGRYIVNLQLQEAAGLLKAAKKVVVFTGAGLSAPSGIPTFRDPLSGLWTRLDPAQLETAKAFRADAALVWGWYLWRRQQVARAQPNPAHMAIARLTRGGQKVTVVTQNIDDLHERAGSSDVVHLHGSLATPKCFACHRPGHVDCATPNTTEQGERIEPPRCLRCNGKLRPGVVWFGEDLPADAWKSAHAAVHDCDLLLSIGTSGVVLPAARLPLLALQAGTTVIHLNLADVSLGVGPEVMLIGSAAELLPLLVR